MAMSDLLYSIFWPPTLLSLIHRTNIWLIGGQFGPALCKLVHFFTDICNIVSMQNLVLITVDRFVAVVFPLRSPLIRSKLCPFFILATWIGSAAIISPHLFTYQLVEYSGEMRCDTRWKKAFGESSSLADYPLGMLYSVYIYPCDVVGPSLLHHHHQAQDTETPRWTVREHSATEEQTKQKRASIVHCYRVSFCVLLVALCYYLFNHTVSSQFHTFFIWFLAVLLCHLLYGGRVLCYQSDYLLCF